MDFIKPVMSQPPIEGVEIYHENVAISESMVDFVHSFELTFTTVHTRYKYENQRIAKIEDRVCHTFEGEIRGDEGVITGYRFDNQFKPYYFEINIQELPKLRRL